MRIITEPKIHIVSQPQFNPHPEYEIPEWDTDDLGIGAFAAKGCYDAYGRTGRSCFENQTQVIEQRHGSVMEHMYFGIFVEGVSRALTLELNRHRLLNISQRSTRYTKEENAAIVLDPYYAMLMEQPVGSPGHDLLLGHVNAARDAFTEYQFEVEQLMKANPNHLAGFALRKWARGKARNILPHCLETRATYTANLRAWRWIIQQRSSRYAEAEIRRFTALLFLKLATVVNPVYLSDFTSELVDGIPEYTSEHSKA